MNVEDSNSASIIDPNSVREANPTEFPYYDPSLQDEEDMPQRKKLSAVGKSNTKQVSGGQQNKRVPFMSVYQVGISRP